jgi:isopentenyldiphosphate isomerase
VAAALIIGSVFVMRPKPAGDVAQQTVPPAPTQAPSNSPSQAGRVAVKNDADSARKTNVETPLAASQNAQEQQADDEQFLDEVSQRAPMMKAAYENELRSVNSYISETRIYAQQNPEDEDARRQLMQAYEQKQMLYQMALSNIQ